MSPNTVASSLHGYSLDRICLSTTGVYDRAELSGRRKLLLYWALVFLVVALIAGVLGFTGIAMAAAGIAKLLFVVFLVLFLLSLLMHIGRGRTVR